MTQKKELNFMIFEDERSQMELLKRSILKKFPCSDIHTEDNMYSVFYTIPLFNPEILIVDYQFENMKITDEEKIIMRLFKFKSLVLIYSSHDPKIIRQDIQKKYGIIPANFRIISKREPIKLLNEIARYNEKRSEGFDGIISSISQ